MQKIKIESQYILQLVLHLLVALFLFTGCRFLFYYHNIPHFSNIDPSEILKAFFYGIRFDMSILVYINGLFCLLSILPIRFRTDKWYKNVQYYLFLGCNGLALSWELIGTAYYPFAFRRMLPGDFLLMQNTTGLLGQFFQEYYLLILLFIGGIFLLHFLYKKTSISLPNQTNFIVQLLFFFISVGGLIILARGGLGLRPLQPINAAVYVDDVRAIPLVTNTSMHLLFSLQLHTLKEKHYFPKGKAEKIYSTRQKGHPGTIRYENVVVIVLESFGQEYIGKNNKGISYTPFFDSLRQAGLYFENAYANGLRSTQGILAISAGFPSLMPDPLMYSAYQNNKISSFGGLLKEKGYRSAFFHGANPGSMQFERFAMLSGIENYYDRRHYNNDVDYDGTWGIWDVPFFQYTLQQLDTFQQPFAAMLFSLTSHHPYKVEDWFAQKHPEKPPLFRSVLYTDYALQQFFATAKKKDWYNNTLFVITADHTGQSFRPKYQTPVGKYKIPILLYHPTDSTIKGQSNILFQQTDIMPTVLDYIHFDENYTTFGKKYHDTDKRYAFMFENGIYQIVDNDYILLFDGTKTVGFYHYKKDILMKNNLKNKNTKKQTELEDALKSAIQQYHFALIYNKIVGS